MSGLASPMDFNGLVRHYYLRQGDDVAELRINLAGKKNRRLQSHAIGLRMRNDLQAIADRHRARMKLVETPPGPPVIASVVAEVYGQPDHRYEDLLLAADTVRARLAAEPGVVDVDRRARSGPAEVDLRHRQGEGRPERHYHGADRRHASGGAGGRHGRRWCAATPSAIRCGSSCDSPCDRRTSAADLAQGAGQRQQRSTGSAGRIGTAGRRPAWTR